MSRLHVADIFYLSGMRWLVYVAFAVSPVSTALSQCPVSNFSLPETACLNENVLPDNTATNSTKSEWFLCSTAYTTTPALTKLVSGYGAVYYSKFLNKGSEAYLFFVSQTQNRLVGLRFTNLETLDFEIHCEIDLSPFISNPSGIDIINDDGDWVGLVTSISAPFKLVKIVFDEDIQTATEIEDLTSLVLLNTPFDVKFVQDGEDFFAFVTNSTATAAQQLARLSFGNSTANEPAVSYVAMPSAQAASIQFSYSCNSWTGLVSSRNGKIFRIDFGSDLNAATPPVTELTVSSPLNDPGGLAVVEEHDEIFLIIQSRNGNTYSGKLSTINDNSVEITNFGNVDTSSRDWGIEVFFHNGTYKIITSNFTNGAVGGLFVLDFAKNCPASTRYTAGASESFLFRKAGTFKISLRVGNAFGDTHTSTKEITVLSSTAPELTALHSSAYCISSPVSFSFVSDLDLASHAWDFGDGTAGSSDASPEHSYATPGLFNIALSATATNGCDNFVTSTIDILAKPLAAFGLPSNPLLCTNNSFTFETTTPDIYDGNLSYQWFVDNNPVSTERDLNYTFTTTGPKDIKLVTAIPGCSDEITQTTSQVEEGPVVNYSFEGICEDDVFNFRNEITDPVEDYLWDFGDGVTSDQPHVTHTFSGHGEHPVSLTATNPIGCENVVTKVISVHSKPIVNFSADGPPNACTGTPTNFQNQTTNPDARQITGWLWSFDDPGSPEPETVSEPEHIFENAGTYSVSLTATTAEGCTGIAEKEIVIHATPSTAFTRSASCLNVPTLFTGPSDPAITSHYWEIGTSYYLTASPTHTFKSSGSHPLYVEVTADNGCVASHSESISVPVPLNADFSVLKNCVGQEAVFTDITSGAEPVASTSWSVNGVPSASGSPLAYTFNVEGDNDVTLTVVSDAGCTYVKSKTVAIVPPPVAGFSSAPQTGAYPLDVDFTNTSSLATHYLWEFLDGSGTTTTETSPSYAFIGEGSFDVRLTAYNAQGCSSLYEEQITTVAPLPDVHIETITLVPVPDGSHKLVVTLNNRGNTILRELVLDIDVAGKLALRGILNDAIAPGAQHNFVFSGGIVNAGMLRYLCASVTLQNDVNPEGNRLCREFEDQLFVFPAYPNPATEVLNVEWISENANPVRVSLSDAMGRRLFSSDLPNSPGLNHYTISLEGISNGLYFLVIEDGSSEMNQRIVVSDKP